MIIMLNGAFGVGKTSLSNILVNKIENSMIFDPEEVGYMVRIVTNGIRQGDEDTDDFQDIELWRKLTVETARQLKEKYNRDLIIPMTIYKKNNFDYIESQLREIDEEVFHFCLVASHETIHKRLAERGDKLGSWSFKQTEKCLEAFKDNKFNVHVDTERKNSEKVSEWILEKIRK